MEKCCFKKKIKSKQSELCCSFFGSSQLSQLIDVVVLNINLHTIIISHRKCSFFRWLLINIFLCGLHWESVNSNLLCSGSVPAGSCVWCVLFFVWIKSRSQFMPTISWLQMKMLLVFIRLY